MGHPLLPHCLSTLRVRDDGDAAFHLIRAEVVLLCSLLFILVFLCQISVCYSILALFMLAGFSLLCKNTLLFFFFY